MCRREFQQQLFLWLILSTATTACNFGDIGHPEYYGGTGDWEAYEGGFTGFSEENPDFMCPSGNNTRPKFDHWLDGTFFFQVCANRRDRNTILVHGQTAHSDLIRVYPAEYVSATQVFVFEDPQNAGQILSQSTQVSEQAGATFVFNTLQPTDNFNAVFIIEESARAAMENCLAAQDYYYCPDFSFGRFR